jgi:hypothetical protein
MRHPAGETVTVTRPGGPIPDSDDGQGNPILGPPSTFEVSDVAIAPAGSEEDPQALGLWVVTGYTLFLPYGTDLLPADRLTIRGVDGWQVEGDSTAAGWRNPFTGEQPGVVVSVRRS